jgi:Probable transposase.
VLQRTLSRKKFLSKNWLKTKTRLAKQHERVKDFRRDLFFKLGALLAQEYDLLVLEDLDVQGLIQSGTKRGGGFGSTTPRSQSSERCWSGGFEKEENRFYLSPLTTLHVSVSCVVGSTRV